MTKTGGMETKENTWCVERDLSHFRLEERWLTPYDSDLALRAFGQRIAVIGAGPAGISAAHILAHLGYTVTIFESLPIIGGMLAVGIPAYRRPAKLVEQLMVLVNQPGITVQLHTVIGQDLSFWQLQEQFDAILLAIGLQHSVPLGISGEDLLQGVLPALDFLKQYHLQHIHLYGDVAVIGGGCATIDVARLAIRSGAHSVRVFLPGILSDLPARREECEAAGKEGVLFHPTEMPRSIIGTEEATVHGVRCQSTRSERTDVGNEQAFTYRWGTDRRYFLNTVLVAIGEEADLSCLSGVDLHLPFQRKGDEREEGPCTTDLPGVFVAGDIAGGPRTLQHAFTSGYEAAHVIHRRFCAYSALQNEGWQQTDRPVTC